MSDLSAQEAVAKVAERIGAWMRSPLGVEQIIRWRPYTTPPLLAVRDIAQHEAEPLGFEVVKVEWNTQSYYSFRVLLRPITETVEVVVHFSPPRRPDVDEGLDRERLRRATEVLLGEQQRLPLEDIV